MDTGTFYATTSAVSFTLLGFWWVVVQFRHEEMTADPGRRRLAFVVSLHFILPGLMSLGALLTGDAPLVWRLTFGIAGIAGMIAVVTRRADPDAERARSPPSVGTSGSRCPCTRSSRSSPSDPTSSSRRLGLAPLQVEGAIMTLLVVLGIIFAWALFTDPADGRKPRGLDALAARRLQCASPMVTPRRRVS